MNVSEIITDARESLNYESGVSSTVTDRLKRFMNKRHRMILSMPGMAQLRDDAMTFTSVTGQGTYSLPPYVGRINAIYDANTNQRKLEEQSLQWLRTVDPRTQNGTPWVYVPRGIVETLQQPPAVGANLYVVSTNNGDTTQNVFVEGMRANTTGTASYTVTATLTGNTAVGPLTGSPFMGITKFYLSANGAGLVYLANQSDALTNANAVIYSVIPLQSTYARYRSIQLWPTPDGEYTYSLDFTREILDMTANTDQPLLPPDFHYLLPLGIRIDEYEHLNDDRRFPLEKDWLEGVSRLINWNQNSPDLVIIPGPRRVAFSRLGPGYPASEW